MHLFIDNINILIDNVFSSSKDAKQRWKQMMQEYIDAFTILRQPHEYSDDDIRVFQSKMEDFFTAFV